MRNVFYDKAQNEPLPPPLSGNLACLKHAFKTSLGHDSKLIGLTGNTAANPTKFLLGYTRYAELILLDIFSIPPRALIAKKGHVGDREDVDRTTVVFSLSIGYNSTLSYPLVREVLLKMVLLRAYGPFGLLAKICKRMVKRQTKPPIQQLINQTQLSQGPFLIWKEIACCSL